MSRPALGAAAGLVALALSWSGVPAAEKTHTVRAGESASEIAKRYYGRHELSSVLLQYNGKSGSMLKVGETLKVPYCAVHRVQSGDSWSAIAKRYLGKTSAYTTIATFNSLAPEAPLRVGTEITIPVILRHKLGRGETLASVAERFYGDPARAKVLQQWNAIQDPRRLSVGSVLEVPIVDPRLMEARTAEIKTASTSPPPAKPPAPETKSATAATRPAKPPAVPAPPPEPAPVVEAPPRFTAEIAAATAAFEDGDYDLARKMLEGLRVRVRSEGNDADKSDLFRLLTFVYVAFDLRKETCDAWEELVALDAPPSLDPDRVSPKVFEALSGCEPRAPGSQLN